MPNRRRIVFIAVFIVVLGLLAALGYNYWYQPTYAYYSTDQASVTGSLVNVAAPASGQISDLYFDVGTNAQKGDVLATIKVINPAASVVSAGPSVSRVLARVTSPVSGTVAVRNVSVGNTVVAGQPIATLVNLNQLWVVVNVDEARLAEIRPGQVANVQISNESKTFRGKVTDIGSATNDLITTVLSLTSSDSTKRVPVKIVFDYSGYRLTPGMSATVTIYTNGAP
ncbi:MAG: efflux RND transporter periplasmic adaptor subunit [Chloroflexota bacterium]|nr:efflux RND transporter periplasmic adaptor subunit [Chloroflexota bacterium]